VATDLDHDTDLDLDVEQPPPGARRLTLALVTVLAVAVTVIAVAGGYYWGSRGTSSSSTSLPKADSVDAGFARDMATHHQQAVTMAAYVRDTSTDPAIVTLAYDIESSQSVQMGEMIGWLSEWGISRTSGTPMDWMPSSMSGMDMTVGSDGALMPGMATAAQMTELQNARGKKLDTLFLQLMIRHHEGGLPMARYEVAHGTVPAVRQLAQNMVVTQTREIAQMTGLLRQLGGRPLPPPH
jgi:uncharacterized protein (DUF305 family)